MGTLIIEKHTIELVNENKILFPKSGITKREIITYYELVAPYLLPFTKNHPLAMLRYPDGINHEGFYQKEAGVYFPRWIKKTKIKSLEREHVTNYVLCNNTATLIYLANQATITLHSWLSSVGTLRYPDKLVFDLDPSDTTNFWALLTDTAFMLKKELEKHGLTPFVMLTGSKGIHVTVPLVPKIPFSKVKLFADTIAHAVCAQNPNYLTQDVRKNKRVGKIFIDTLRNQWAQLSVVPYSLRAIEGAPTATPITWQELEAPHMHAQRFGLHTMAERLKNTSAWHDFFTHARAL